MMMMMNSAAGTHWPRGHVALDMGKSITGHAQSEKPGALCPTLRIRKKDSPNISEETSLQARATRIAQTKRWENPRQ